MSSDTVGHECSLAHACEHCSVVVRPDNAIRHNEQAHDPPETHEREPTEGIGSSVPRDDRPPPPTILIFWSVENSERCVELMSRNVAMLSNYPNVRFAVSHFDGQNDRWLAQAWYASERVVYKSVDRGTKVHQWKRLSPAMVRAYDYLWLCDSDMGFERVDMGLVLNVLVQHAAWYCQLSIVGATPHTRSTDIAHLRYDPDKPTVEWVCNRTEVGVPLLNTKAWDLIHEQIGRMDDRSDWGIDGFWDELFQHAHRPFPLVHTPLVHYDFRNVEVNGAVRGWIPFEPIPDKANRFAQFWATHRL
jgi:hypothetical protein